MYGKIVYSFTDNESQTHTLKFASREELENMLKLFDSHEEISSVTVTIYKEKKVGFFDNLMAETA